MNLSNLESHQSIQEDRRATDPEYTAEADRLALADAVSVAVVRYRTNHKLSQTEFAKKLGWKQPHVARLESGDVTPSLESLQRLARAGVIEVQVKRQGTIVKSIGVKRDRRPTVGEKSMVAGAA
ncbi:helix-turn-helix domain-containing protein [Microbacterium sp.]|uniref:helix-turn-helix domain-containing protein n=1 Tax=Microbacterium sp. TaxID=51671 RepID=UPI003F94446D